MADVLSCAGVTLWVVISAPAHCVGKGALIRHFLYRYHGERPISSSVLRTAGVYTRLPDDAISNLETKSFSHGGHFIPRLQLLGCLVTFLTHSNQSLVEKLISVGQDLNFNKLQNYTRI